MAKLTAIIIAVGFVAACSKDDEAPVLPSDPTISATSIALIDAPTEVVKGDSVEIRFRVNPSSVTFCLEDVNLDCLESTIYRLKEDDRAVPAKAKTSYVTSSEHFSAVKLMPDINERGDTLAGQWRLTILPQAGENIFDVSKLAVVLANRDEAGNRTLVSSAPFEMTMVPTIGEGTSIWHASNYSFTRNGNDNTEEIVNAYISVDENTYVTSDNSDTKVYSLKKYLGTQAFIPQNAEDETLFGAIDSLRTCGYVEFIPDTAEPKWQELDAAQGNTLTVNALFKLTDIFGKTAETDITFNYFNVNDVDYQLPVKPSREYQGKTTYSMADFLASVGYDKKDIDNLRRKSLTFSPKVQAPFFVKFDSNTLELHLTHYSSNPNPQENESIVCYFSIRIMPTVENLFFQPRIVDLRVNLLNLY